jgi:hypothetical protein
MASKTKKEESPKKRLNPKLAKKLYLPVPLLLKRNLKK